MVWLLMSEVGICLRDCWRGVSLVCWLVRRTLKSPFWKLREASDQGFCRAIVILVQNRNNSLRMYKCVVSLIIDAILVEGK